MENGVAKYIVRKYEGSGLRTSLSESAMVISRASGCWLVDENGRRLLDFAASYAVSNIGHCHPKVTAAICEQAKTVTHLPSGIISQARAKFYQALSKIALPEHQKFFPAITGAMANEIALAIAKNHRPYLPVLTFSSGYFGRSFGTVGIGGDFTKRSSLKVGLNDVQFLPYPDERVLGPNAVASVLTFLRTLTAPGGGVGPLAAIIVEPVQGAEGVVIPRKEFLMGLREFCDATGTVLIFDEIQAGFGRTGRNWSCEHFGVVPDIITCGKGIGGGMPVAAVMGKPDLMKLPKDGFSTTFLANSVNLSASAAAIDVYLEENLAQRSAELGEHTLATLRGALSHCNHVSEIRGLGLWIGIDLQTPDGEPAPELAKAIQNTCMSNGVLVGIGGARANTLRLAPPLIISNDDLHFGTSRIITAIATAKKAL